MPLIKRVEKLEAEPKRKSNTPENPAPAAERMKAADALFERRHRAKAKAKLSTQDTIALQSLGDAPRQPSFAEKQLEEQNRQLREESARLQMELEALTIALERKSEASDRAPEPLSKPWQLGQQERALGKLEGRADAFSEVITDLLVLVAKGMRIE